MSRMLRPAILLSLLAAACSASDDATDTSEGELGSIQSLFSDARRLDLGDLTRVTAGFATNALNDKLTVGIGPASAGVHFDKPAVFAAHAQPNSVLPDDAEIKALDTVVTGLAARFGEKELGTQVNAARLAHLENTADDYFVESAFTVDAGLAPRWSFDAGGFVTGASVTLGFDASTQLSSRVIVATDNAGIGAVVRTPLAAMKNARGFIYPRGIDDVRAMKPGEMFALRGSGKLGANFGVGAPIFISDPGPLSYRVVVSAGVAGVLSGQIDVQVVRLDGDEVVVDLGLEKGKRVSIEAGVHDAWGVKGICDDNLPCLRPLTLAGQRIDLQKLVEKAIEKQLDKYLSFDVSASAAEESSRVSLSRFRMHLDRGNRDETAKALEQLLKFDMRLAQALYNRDLDQQEPAVRADFDAVRAATTSTRNFGFELLGMNVYHRAIVDRQGTFTLQTPDGAKSILFDYLSKDAGLFQRKHGYSRTGVAAETVDASSPTAFRSEAHLFVQTLSADTSMDNDFALDNLDAMVLAAAGPTVLDTIDKFGNQIERTLWQKCPLGDNNSWDERCNLTLLDDASFKALKTQGLVAVDAAIANEPEDFRKLVHAAAETRFTIQSVGILETQGGGPKVAFSGDMHFDDDALDALTSRSRADYLAMLRAFIGSTTSPRRDVRKPADKEYFRKIAEDRSNGAVDKMADQFEAGARAYRAILDAEKRLPTLLSGKRYVSAPLGIRFTVGRSEAESIESVVLRSTSHDRALAAAALYDGIFGAASGLDNVGLEEEHAALYPLAALVPHTKLEAAMSFESTSPGGLIFGLGRPQRFDKAGLTSSAASAKGREVSTISAGMFDIKSIASAP